MTRERLIEQNPAAEMQLPREEKRLPRHALSREEAEAVLAQPDISTALGLRDRAIMETLYSTGLRRAELLSLEASDLDRERTSVSFKPSLDIPAWSPRKSTPTSPSWKRQLAPNGIIGISSSP
jgi:integrase/recombinase XerD